MALPEALERTLIKMRAAVLNDPQILLEQWSAGPQPRPGEHVFADMYGPEDELLQEFVRMDGVPHAWYSPIPQRVTFVLADAGLADYQPVRVAEYRPLSGFSRAAVHAEYLPQWKCGSDFLVRLLYVRYKRRL